MSIYLLGSGVDTKRWARNQAAGTAVTRRWHRLTKGSAWDSHGARLCYTAPQAKDHSLLQTGQIGTGFAQRQRRSPSSEALAVSLSRRCWLPPPSRKPMDLMAKKLDATRSKSRSVPFRRALRIGLHGIRQTSVNGREFFLSLRASRKNLFQTSIL